MQFDPALGTHEPLQYPLLYTKKFHALSDTPFISAQYWPSSVDDHPWPSKIPKLLPKPTRTSQYTPPLLGPFSTQLKVAAVVRRTNGIAIKARIRNCWPNIIPPE